MAGVPTVGPELPAASTWGVSKQTEQRSAIGDSITGHMSSHLDFCRDDKLVNHMVIALLCLLQSGPGLESR